MWIRISAVAITLGTLIVIGISWKALRRPRSYGFFRFFAFEAILCLGVLNAPYWFRDWAAPRQIASWTLLSASLFLVIHAVRLFRLLGRQTAPSPGSADLRFEHTSNLITVGAYRYIRHPMCASLLYLAWGAALKNLSTVTVGLALVASVFLLATAKAEERENLLSFGPAYRDYMARTRLFVPFVF